MAVSAAILGCLVALLTQPWGTAAQSEVEGWSTPMNLSESGVATNPHLIFVPSDETLVAWDEATVGAPSSDSLSGVVRRRKGAWEAVSREPLAWTGRPVQFLAGENGQIHAFWIDDDGNLLYRSAGAGEFSSPALWNSAMQLSNGVFAFDAVMDKSQSLHVATLSAGSLGTVEPGLFYQRSGRNGLGWSSPKQLYASDYYRKFAGGTTTPLFGEDVPVIPAVDIEAGQEEDPSIYIGWDNPSLKRLFLATSNDGGVSFGETLEVQGPDLEDPYAAPRQPVIQALRDQVLLIWKVYQSGGSCEQLYRLSTDQGKSWGGTGLVLGETGRCSETMQAFQVSPNRLLVFATLQSQAFLMGWDGAKWTKPRAQPELDYFEDERTFSFVELACRQADLSGGVLAVVGCDRGSGGDIWLREQQVDLSAILGKPPPGWTMREPLPVESSEIYSLSVAGDASPVARVLWSAPGSAPGSASSDIHYIGVAEQDTIGPIRVLRSQPGKAESLDLTIDPEGRLLAVWSGGELGQVYFTGTSIGEAGSPGGWIPPAAVIESPGQSPRLALTGEGASQMVFAVPVNESRGVYNTQLTGSTFTWSTVERVHDATASGCEVVASPDVAVGSGDRVYAVWSCWTPPGGVGPLAAYLSKSGDAGRTWSPAVQVVSRAPAWTELVATGGEELHLIWGEQRSGGETTWHAWSQDGGEQWSEPESVMVTDGSLGLAHALADVAGRIHLLQAVEQDSKPPELRYAVWDGGRWELQPSLPLRVEHLDDLEAFSAALRGDTRLLAVYSGLGPRLTEGGRGMEIVMAEFPVEAGTVRRVMTPAVGEGTAAALQATATIAASPTASPVPTSALPADGRQSDGSTSAIVGSLAFLGAGALIGAGVFLLRRRRKHSADDQVN